MNIFLEITVNYRGRANATVNKVGGEPNGALVVMSPYIVVVNTG